MKKVISAFVLIFSLVFIVFAQNPVCPSLTVMGPPGIIKPGEPEVFTAHLGKEAEKYKIEYFWTVIHGKIVGGQGTNKIKALADQKGEVITATVSVSGLPQGCQATNSASRETDIRRTSSSPRKIDEFSVSSLLIPKQRLDSIATDLKNDPTGTLVIEEWITPKVTDNMIKEKLFRSFLYLTRDHGISPQRIVWQVFSGKVYQTTYWIIPAGAQWAENRAANRKIKGGNFYPDLERHFPKAKKKSLPKRTKG